MDVMRAGHGVDIARPLHRDEEGRRVELRGMASMARRYAAGRRETLAGGEEMRRAASRRSRSGLR
jgi:hypothetical protein